MKKIRWCPVAVGLLTLAVLLVALDVSGDRYEERRAARARQIVYQEAVNEYAVALKLGTSRSEVESYLHSRDRKFERSSRLSNSASGAADLVKIGAERPPWFCSRLDFFAAFKFSWTDKLQDVVLYSELVDCL